MVGIPALKRIRREEPGVVSNFVMLWKRCASVQVRYGTLHLIRGRRRTKRCPGPLCQGLPVCHPILPSCWKRVDKDYGELLIARLANGYPQVQMERALKI